MSVTAPLGRLLAAVADQVVAAVPAATAACVAVLDGATVRVLEFSAGAAAVALDERQYPVGYGPALAGARAGRAVVVAAAVNPCPHEDYRRLAARFGVEQAVSFPIGLPVRRASGSLTLYAGPGDALVEETARHRAADVVAELTGIVSDAVLFDVAVRTAVDLRRAMESAAVIEQAKGMIMMTEHCSADEAFERLRQQSNRSNRKLRDVAALVVDSVSGDRRRSAGP